MAKLIVSLDGVVVREVQITKDRTTLGRRPYNDVVIDNLAVSGEHAVVLMQGGEVFLEDNNSTNGTYMAGRPVKREALQSKDSFEIGKYKITYIGGETQNVTAAAERAALVARSPAFSRSVFSAPTGFGVPSGFGTPSGFGAPSDFGALSGVSPASIKVLNGGAAGREVPLTKVVTTVGKPGVQVASITKRPGGYVFAHVEGATRPVVNGQTVAREPVPLTDGDVIELAGTQMRFMQG
jgi:pSer/pThr/pTyr-binding forkhead associated (FHA) protein